MPPGFLYLIIYVLLLILIVFFFKAFLHTTTSLPKILLNNSFPCRIYYLHFLIFSLRFVCFSLEYTNHPSCFIIIYVLFFYLTLPVLAAAPDIISQPAFPISHYFLPLFFNIYSNKYKIPAFSFQEHNPLFYYYIISNPLLHTAVDY